MVEPGETFSWRNGIMVLLLKSGIAFMRTRPVPLPRLSTATRTSWHAHGLKPHLIRTFKLSRDPEFTEKLEDIVGLYNPDEASTSCFINGSDQPGGRIDVI
jgi:hypothetical protein